MGARSLSVEGRWFLVLGQGSCSRPGGGWWRPGNITLPAGSRACFTCRKPQDGVDPGQMRTPGSGVVALGRGPQTSP
uniref:Uncharacterized protein n=1 Tax=Knipowitschia caucasica TaxID=637954 RepID=A0AAV2MMK7_KNICA